MASNPLVPQGTLNKLRGSVSVIDLPQLNITSSFLGDDGISLSFEGDASAYLGTMTGAVPSPNPYQMATVTLHLLKTQVMSSQWKAQMESDTSIGDVSITTDASTLDGYYLSNCTIKGVQELTFAGKTPDYVVTVQGIYYVNASLFDQQ